MFLNFLKIFRKFRTNTQNFLIKFPIFLVPIDRSEFFNDPDFLSHQIMSKNVAQNLPNNFCGTHGKQQILQQRKTHYLFVKQQQQQRQRLLMQQRYQQMQRQVLIQRQRRFNALKNYRFKN